MKKCLSLLVALSMLLAMCVLPVSADELTAVATSDIWEVEDFEDYTTGVNWLTSVESNYIKATDKIEVAENAWTVGGTTDGVTVEVVDGKTAIGDSYTGGNVLHVKGASESNFFAIRRNSNAATGKTIADMAGKQLVIEGDVYVKNAVGGEVTFMTYANAKTPAKASGMGVYATTSGSATSSNWHFRSGGEYNGAYYARATVSAPTTGFVTAKYVVDVSEKASATFANTSRGYIDGVLYSTTYNPSRVSELSATSTGNNAIAYAYANAQGWDDAKRENTAFISATTTDKTSDSSYVSYTYDGKNYWLRFTDLAANTNTYYPYKEGDRVVDIMNGNYYPNDTGKKVDAGTFYGTTFSTLTQEYYIDNLKAYLVDKFEMGTATNTTNYFRGSTIAIPFNSEISETLREITRTNSTTNSNKTWALANGLITLVDAEGNVVENGIESATLSADKKTVNVVLGDVAGNTDYKLSIDTAFCDVYGQGLDNHNKPTTIDVHTAEVFEITEAPESINDLIPSDPRAVEVEVSAAIKAVEAELNDITLETSYNGSTATIFFANVAEPKSGNVNVKITSADGQEIDLAIPAKSVTDGFVKVYDDNLEDLEKGNLITDGTVKSLANGNFTFNTTAASLSAAGTAEIATDPVQGKVLKFATKAAGNFSVTYKGDQSDMVGKVLFLRTKYYVPADFTNSSSSGNTGGAATVAPGENSTSNPNTPAYKFRTTPQLSLNSGHYNHNSQEGNNPVKGDWNDIITVIDQTTEGTLTNPHTSRRYINGEISAIKGYDIDAGETKNEGFHYMYDTAPNGYYGIWDFSKAATFYEQDTTALTTNNKFSTTKMYGTYTMLGNAATDKDGPIEAWLMIDDFQAYYADKFKITSISENQSMFYPVESTLKITFNHPIDQTQANSVKLYNAEGEVVEGWTANVANGGYAIDFVLENAAAEAGEYKLVFTPEFHDVRSFQGLGTKNKNLEYTLNVAKYVAFTANYENTISDFISGKGTKSVIGFGTPTGLTNANVEDAFDVKDGDGNAVTTGWSATVADDKMSITLDFTNLPDGDYTVKSNEKLVDTANKGLYGGQVINITITAKVKEIVLFEEDFEDTDDFKYTIGEDWLDTAPANGKWKAGYSRERADKTAYANDKIEVVNKLPENVVNANLSGNALHIYAEQEATYVTKGIAAKAVMDPIDIDATYPGKVLIMEADVFGNTIADGSKPLIASFTSALAPGLNYYKHNGSGFKYEGTYFSPASKDHTGDAYHMRWLKSLAATDYKFVTVIDQRNALDTVKMYGNGKILSEKSNTLITDHPLYQQTVYEFPLKANDKASVDYWGTGDAGSFYGPEIVGQTYSKNAVNTDMYIDNIKVYLVDAFEITGVEGASTAFNTAKDTIKINFSNKVASLPDATANIKVTNAEGTEVAYTASLAEGDYQVVIDIDDNVTGELKIVVSPEIQDEFGQSLAHKYYDYDYKFNGTGTGYIVKHGKTGTTRDDLYDGKDYAWASTLDAANAIGGTVYTYTWTADGNGNVTMKNPIAPDAEATFTANGWMRDEDAMKLVTVIKTTKSTSLYAEATPATVNGTSVSTSLTFTNPEEEALPVWYIVAAYGEYNEMLGCESASLSVAKGTLEPISVNVTTKSSNIKSVKVYVWDGYKTMVPYQEAEEIYPAVAE